MLVWVGGRIKMINAAKAEALAAFLNHLYIYIKGVSFFYWL